MHSLVPVQAAAAGRVASDTVGTPPELCSAMECLRHCCLQVESLSRDVNRQQRAVTIMHSGAPGGSNYVIYVAGVGVVSAMYFKFVCGWRLADMLYVTRGHLRKGMQEVNDGRQLPLRSTALPLGEWPCFWVIFLADIRRKAGIQEVFTSKHCLLCASMLKVNVQHDLHWQAAVRSVQAVSGAWPVSQGALMSFMAQDQGLRNPWRGAAIQAHRLSPAGACHGCWLGHKTTCRGESAVLSPTVSAAHPTPLLLRE